MRSLRYILAVGLVTGAMVAPWARAQQQSSQQSSQQSEQQSSQQPQNQAAQPIPAYRSPFALGTDNDAQDANGGQQTLEPDTHSLVGAQDLSLGAPKTGYSFWTPYFELSSTLDSNGVSTNGTGWATWATVYGGIDLRRTSSNSSLTVNYLGGGAFSDGTGTGNGVIQELGLGEQLTFRRASIAFLDQFGYLPESSFGFAGIGGAALSTGGNLGLQTGFTPNQSILTSLGQRLSNSSIVEVNTFLTPRSTLTFVGAYGLLYFFDNNLNDSREASAQAGYNYQLTRKDTIAVFYRFDGFRYDNINQSINDNTVQASYARRVTGRLAFRLAAGPSIAFSEIPISGSSGTSTETSSTAATGSKIRQIFWDASSSLTYQLERAQLQGSYYHGVTGGSGVLAGAQTDNVSGSASRQLTPNLNGVFTIGYSRNEGLAVTPTSTLASSGQTYDYWFGGVNFGRTFGRSTRLQIGYQVNYQTSSAAFCVTTPCSTTFLLHQVFLSLGWNPRPIAF
jgi:hypothetical protein